MKNLPSLLRQRSTLALCAAITFVFSLYFFFFLFTPASYTRAQEARLVSFPSLTNNDRLTIVSPHLDDESLGLGGLIAEARQKDVPVSIIFMTNGDANYYGAGIEYRKVKPLAADYLQYGRSRQLEALNAVSKLGVQADDVYFLGLPDRGLLDIYNANDPSKAYFSKYTRASSSPYERTYIKALPYSKTSVESALAQVINETKPTRVFSTLIEDTHTDHSATGHFLRAILPRLTSSPRVYLYLVHHAKYPLPRGINPNYPLLPPQKLADKDWNTIQLSPEIVELKHQSIMAYVSQIKIPDLGTLMKSFVRKNELVVDGFE